MFAKFRNWLRNRSSAGNLVQGPDLQRTGAHPARPEVRSKHKLAQPNRDHSGRDGNAPGKNVRSRNKFVREEAGTHETLKILDDSLVDSGEEAGLDPYNTGGFDRSKNWDRRFGK